MNLSRSAAPILPGATIGVLGSGQLGRMFTIAAKQMGFRVCVLSATHDSPAGQVADNEIQADFLDTDAVEEFAKQVAVTTLEFENVPSQTIEAALKHTMVRPGLNVLETMQHRLKEKTFLRNAGIPVAQFKPVTDLVELKSACKTIMPAVVKTVLSGYDGKGQVVINDIADADAAWQRLDSNNTIIEELVPLESEFSIIGARTPGGNFKSYAPIHNVHRNHILDVSSSPFDLPGKCAEQAEEIVRTIMTELDAIGVLCVEFFLCSDGRMLVNEIAPRPHNSGHLTIEAHATSQFEQQVRAVCGLNLGATTQNSPAAMVNLLGDCWSNGTPNWNLALAKANVKLHLYGKESPQIGRKMGHLTTTANTTDQAIENAIAARELLSNLEGQAVSDGIAVESQSS